MKFTYMKGMGTFSPSVSTQMEAKIKNLQGQIDTINDASDVADVVATYSDLQAYDKSTLTDKAVIKVLTDSSHDNKTTYYRYVKSNNDFTYIGAVESYYTKAEADAKLKVHTDNKNNPHSVTKAQVGLGNCDNTSDSDKPVSTAQQTALNSKQDTLVSGTNIKTINGNSIIGSGDLSIGTQEDVWTQDNLKAGKNIQFKKHINPNIITEDTVAVWHLDNTLDSVVGNYTLLGYDTNFTQTSKFGGYALSGLPRMYYYSPGYGGADISSQGLTLRTPITVDFWFRTASMSYGSIVRDYAIGFNKNNGTKFGATIKYTPDTSTIVLQDLNATNTETVALLSNTWNHIAYEYNGDFDGTPKSTIYVNGVPKLSSNLTITTNFGLTRFNIYGPEPTAQFGPEGYVDEIRVSKGMVYDGDFSNNLPTEAYAESTDDSYYEINNTLDISGKADKANTLTGYGITDAYTKTQVDTNLSTKQDTITGSNGEVAYHNGTSVFTQSILNLGYTCASAAEVNQCKNNAPSFSAVFNTWKKFSHKNATNDAIPSEMTAWTYDSGTDTITQPLNTESYVGFISPKSYSSYDITVRCYSTGSDDDSIGLVAAFAKDSNGLEHTLSFIRSPGGTSAKWVAILDYNQFALTGTSYGQKILVNNSAASTTPASTASWNTESIGTGTVIKMVRSGNVITAKCSQFNSNTIDDNTLITVDLDALSDENPTLNLFKGSSPWGYSNFSQPNSKYENISVTDPDGMIFDIPNNQVLQYSNGTWVVVSGQTPISAIGAGRLSYNSVTGKLFFCTGTDIIQIGKNTDI